MLRIGVVGCCGWNKTSCFDSAGVPKKEEEVRMGGRSNEVSSSAYPVPPVVDEAAYKSPFECAPDQYQCHDNVCVSGYKRCNGIADCADGSDEFYCDYEDEGILLHINSIFTFAFLELLLFPFLSIGHLQHCIQFIQLVILSS